MASYTRIEDVLNEAMAPFAASPAIGLSRQMERVSEQLLALVPQAATGSESRAATVKDGAERALSVGGVATGVGIGLGVPLLIKGITRLFGGAEEPKTLPPLIEFALPESIRVQAGVSDRVPGGAFLIDYGQGGTPRPRTAEASQTNITVQVHAMDSRSFLDHSGDIARAVRQAMLESSVLNDVIREA